MHASLEKKATFYGIWALLMWAVEPLLVSEVNELPICELLSILFASSFLFSAIRLTIKKEWSSVLKQPIFIWLIGLIGVCGSDYAYICGSQYAPIAHVDLIDYLWPYLTVLFTYFLPNEKFSWKNFYGSILGLIGIYILLANDCSFGNVSNDNIFGYTLALIGAILWALYLVFSRYKKEIPTEMIGMYCGVGSVVFLLLHLKLEEFIMPNLQQGSLTVFTGLTGAGIAYQLWNYGIKYGNIAFLSILTYFARAMGMLLLVFFNKVELTIYLIAACVLTSLGALLSSVNDKTIIRIKLLFLKILYLLRINNSFLKYIK